MIYLNPPYEFMKIPSFGIFMVDIAMIQGMTFHYDNYHSDTVTKIVWLSYIVILLYHHHILHDTGIPHIDCWLTTSSYPNFPNMFDD